MPPNSLIYFFLNLNQQFAIREALIILVLPSITSILQISIIHRGLKKIF